MIRVFWCWKAVPCPNPPRPPRQNRPPKNPPNRNQRQRRSLTSFPTEPRLARRRYRQPSFARACGTRKTARPCVKTRWPCKRPPNACAPCTTAWQRVDIPSAMTTFPTCPSLQKWYDTRHVGLWRSLVARPSGGRKVAGSSPASPTISKTARPGSGRVFLYLLPATVGKAWGCCL